MVLPLCDRPSVLCIFQGTASFRDPQGAHKYKHTTRRLTLIIGGRRIKLPEVKTVAWMINI